MRGTLSAVAFSIFLSVPALSQVTLGDLPKPRAWLGAVVADASLYASELGLSVSKGALVLAVYAESPADQAGVRSGDIIIRLGRETTPTRETFDGALSKAKVEVPIHLQVVRETHHLDLEATPQGAPSFARFVQPGASRSPRTWTVALDGTGEFRSPDAAMVQCRYGDTILLKPGRYPRILLFRDGIRIASEPGAATVAGLDGRAGPRDILLEGLVVDAGPERSAITLTKAENVTLRNLRLTGSLWGLFARDSSVKLQTSRIEKNGGGVYAQRSKLSLEGSLLVDNLPQGRTEERGATAVVRLDGGEGFLDRDTLANAHRPASAAFYGIELRDKAVLKLTRSIVAGHRAWLNVLASDTPQELRRLAGRVVAAAKYARHPDASDLPEADKARFLEYAHMNEAQYKQVYGKSLVDGPTRQALEELIQQWAAKAAELRDAADKRERCAAGMTLEGNLFFDVERPPLKGLDKSNRELDPQFADPLAGEWRLSPTSPAVKDGWTMVGAP